MLGPVSRPIAGPTQKPEGKGQKQEAQQPPRPKEVKIVEMLEKIGQGLGLQGNKIGSGGPIV